MHKQTIVLLPSLVQWYNVPINSLTVFTQPQRGHAFYEALAVRLELEHTLRGHTGCVNRLAWNQEVRTAGLVVLIVLPA